MTILDLHLHSYFSNDADFSPKELVELCLDAGISHAALTDHNSVKGIDPALAAAVGKPIEIIPAIEMDCVYRGTILHLLGYGIDHTVPIFDAIEEDVHQQEQENSSLLIQKVRQLGVEFDDEVVAGLAFDGVITGEMIAEAALIYDHRGKNPLLDPYRGDGERSDNSYVNFYWDYCSQRKPAYTPMRFMSLSQAIEIIQANHGVTVLAHPGINVKESPAFLQKIIDEGIQGIEVYTSYHNRQQSAFYREAALSNRLLITCGSDFHGKTKKRIKIGGVDCQEGEKRLLDELISAIEGQR